MQQGGAAMKFGPTRGELWFRLIVSVFGLVLMVVAVTARGVQGIAWVEVVGLASVFFGGTAIWTLIRLFRTRD
jgi:hypothetical protein